MKQKIWRLNRSQIEAIVAQDHTNLFWGSAPPEHGHCYRRGFANYSPEKVGGLLFAKPKNYHGPLSDYNKVIVKEIKTKNNNVRGYRWA